MAHDIKATEEKMKKSVDSLSRELATLRTGRANASMLDRVVVDYYGAEVPLQQLATITVPEGRLLVVAPFDKSSIKDVEKGIQMPANPRVRYFPQIHLTAKK